MNKPNKHNHLQPMKLVLVRTKVPHWSKFVKKTALIFLWIFYNKNFINSAHYRSWFGFCCTIVFCYLYTIVKSTNHLIILWLRNIVDTNLLQGSTLARTKTNFIDYKWLCLFGLLINDKIHVINVRLGLFIYIVSHLMVNEYWWLVRSVFDIAAYLHSIHCNMILIRFWLRWFLCWTVDAEYFDSVLIAVVGLCWI